MCEGEKGSVQSSVMLCNLEKLDMAHLTESSLNVLAASAFILTAAEMAAEGFLIVWCEM